ncbi:MAG: PilZ domain-containing protein [Deltaproteobacteria bacterium]|jgi:c-di-GMP-binding flagellar brake protein YcgR|nr:PilZ domain-containing protein [Deltaproteobacteria bacterium]
MGGPTKEKLDLFEQKIKFTLRPLINIINTSGMNRERKTQLDELLSGIADLQETIEYNLEQNGSTEDTARFTSLVNYLYALIKGASIQVRLPERRQHLRHSVSEGEDLFTQVFQEKNIRILNLSMGGMRLHSLTKLKVGSIFHTKLNSSRHGTIPLKGEVVWSRPKDKGEGYIVGVHFLPMQEDVRRALTNFLEECSPGE